MSKFNKKSSIFALSAIAMFGLPAMAQSIDYGSLEMLFDEPVTTSATGAPQRSTDAPVTMEIISADEIRNSGAVNIPTLLSRLAGVEVQQYGRNFHDVAIRGYNQNKTPRLLVLVNGRQVFQDYYGFTDWDVIPVQLDEIRQIEIVKGPNTALFGFNAVGGVVNIITFNPLYTETNTLRGGVDFNDGVRGSGVATFRPFENTAIRMSAGGQQAQEFEDLPFELRGDPQNEQWAFAAEAGIQATSNTQVFLEGTVSSSIRMERLPSGANIVRDGETTSLRATVTHDGDWGLINATAYRNTQEYLTNPFAPTPSFDVEAGLTVFKVEDLFKVGADHTFRVAGEYRENTLDLILFGNSSSNEYNVFSVGGMWNWAINDQLSSTVAVRSDTLNFEGETIFSTNFGAPEAEREISEISYNAGLVYTPTSRDLFRFQIARGIQTPSLVQLFFSPDVDPSIVNNYAIDYDRQISELNGKMRISVFYQDNQDLFTVANAAFAPGVNIPTGENLGDSELFGVELSFEGRIGNHIDWYASYAINDTTDGDFAQVASYDGLRDVLDFEESNLGDQLKAGAVYDDGKWVFGAHARVVPSRQVFDSLDPGDYQYQRVTVDSYVALDMNLSYRLNDDVTLSLDAFDLTNDDDVQVPGGDIDSRVWASVRFTF
ncbi:TonB-dependent receptor [Ponticaulis sp.]|uniref:TonB-dependent receptor plug domain-containing protein n=1 Tax=Ponticaulis sp. TaxID=2020902 RepID=UPI002608F279|nr:TonB-dependent receptor [Ponticaulis sp.]MDF1680896.1 TonB-dependent receptor [Ponticaulis sp.]